jgi:hypothetical protein
VAQAVELDRIATQPRFKKNHSEGRGRDIGHPIPPAQIPTSSITA